MHITLKNSKIKLFIKSLVLSSITHAKLGSPPEPENEMLASNIQLISQELKNKSYSAFKFWSFLVKF